MSCLFDSVLALWPQAAPNAQALRERCAEHVGADRIKVHGVGLGEWVSWESGGTESLEAYARRMRAPSQWGGGLELVALADLLGVELAVHMVAPAGVGCVGEFRAAEQPPPMVRLNLLYNGSHYTPSHVTHNNPSSAAVGGGDGGR